MTRKEKIEYLSQYIKARRRFECLDTRLKSASSVGYDQVKSSVHKSLVERIHDRDKAYEDMIIAYIEIDSLIGDDIIMGYLFLLCYPIEDIAKTLNMSKNNVKKQLYNALDRLEIK